MLAFFCNDVTEYTPLLGSDVTSLCKLRETTFPSPNFYACHMFRPSRTRCGCRNNVLRGVCPFLIGINASSQLGVAL